MRSNTLILAAIACGLLALSACGSTPDGDDDVAEVDGGTLTPDGNETQVCEQDPNAPCNCFQQMGPPSTWEFETLQGSLPQSWPSKIVPDERNDQGEIWINPATQQPDCKFQIWNLDSGSDLPVAEVFLGGDSERGIDFRIHSDASGRPNAQAYYRNLEQGFEFSGERQP